MKVAFIVNAKARGKAGFYRQVNEIDSKIEFEVFETKARFHATELTQSAIQNGFETIIAVGGDGTINEVVNGFLNNDSNDTQPILGLYPAGTANDFAKSVNATPSLASIFQQIDNKEFKQIDAGKVKTGATSKYFINIADAGLGAEVVGTIDKCSKPFGSHFAFYSTIFLKFFTYKKKKVRIELDNLTWEGSILSMVVANAKYFGSGLCIAPHANLNDGQFAIAIYGEITVIDYLKYLPKIRKGDFIKHSHVHYSETKSARIIPLSDPPFIEADGELFGPAEAVIEIMPKAIRFLMA